jgi:hypothetical protein
MPQRLRGQAAAVAAELDARAVALEQAARQKLAPKPWRARPDPAIR